MLEGPPAAGAAGPRPHSIRTRTIDANGLTFAIDECGAGPDIALCLHGFPESRHSWRHQLPLLAELGWHAVAPDLRGYGGTSRPPHKADYHIDHLVADVAGLIDALGAESGTGRRLLVAHDWGAIIAWIFALRGTRGLDGLIVMNVPHPRVFRDVLRTSWAQKRKSWYVAFFQLPRLPEAMLGARHAEGIGKAFTAMAIDKSAFPPAVIDHYRDNASQPVIAHVPGTGIGFQASAKRPSVSSRMASMADLPWRRAVPVMDR